MAYWQPRGGEFHFFERAHNTNNRAKIQTASKGELLVHRSRQRGVASSLLIRVYSLDRLCDHVLNNHHRINPLPQRCVVASRTHPRPYHRPFHHQPYDDIYDYSDIAAGVPAALLAQSSGTPVAEPLIPSPPTERSPPQVAIEYAHDDATGSVQMASAPPILARSVSCSTISAAMTNMTMAHRAL